MAGAINQLLVTHPRARLYGKWEPLGNLLNDIRAALSLGDTITVLPGCPLKAERSKGPRKHAVTIPYLAGVFLRSRYGDNWTGELVEQDWLDFALAQGYDAARVNQARAQLTAIFHGIRGWVETETQPAAE